ncbi:MAG TPA: hypothetical protein VG755_04340 [Nannocystaceae bacterium]|nr:hypothetical protein [Nannocystaceae bacterium]
MAPPRGLIKQMRITLVCPGATSRSALVTLTRAALGLRTHWYAISRVEHDAEIVEHVTHGHVDERDALRESADWLRTRFGARTTCYGGTVCIVGVTADASATAA